MAKLEEKEWMMIRVPNEFHDHIVMVARKHNVSMYKAFQIWLRRMEDAAAIRYTEVGTDDKSEGQGT